MRHRTSSQVTESLLDNSFVKLQDGPHDAYMTATIQCSESAADMMTPAAARAEFNAEVTYLDTATMGLLPRRSWLALQEALAQWQAGTADAVSYDKPLAEARRCYARLVGVPPPRWPSEATCRCSPG